MSIAQLESVQVEVDKMILQGAIHPVTSNTEGVFVSSTFLVDKKMAFIALLSVFVFRFFKKNLNC